MAVRNLKLSAAKRYLLDKQDFQRLMKQVLRSKLDYDRKLEERARLIEEQLRYKSLDTEIAKVTLKLKQSKEEFNELTDKIMALNAEIKENLKAIKRYEDLLAKYEKKLEIEKNRAKKLIEEYERIHSKFVKQGYNKLVHFPTTKLTPYRWILMISSN
jgi:predicted  nucleic acid-binding Zn-ribbon protein